VDVNGLGIRNRAIISAHHPIRCPKAAAAAIPLGFRLNAAR
jgi:hypothetical protein